MSAFVCQKAPNFTAAAVLPDGAIKEDFSLSDYAGKYVVLFLRTTAASKNSRNVACR